MYRCPVGAEEMLVGGEELTQPPAMPGHQPRIRPGARDPRPQHRIQVQRPAVVVVELPSVAVRVPAVAPVPVLQPGEPRVDLGAAVRGADRGQELLGDHLEEPPVGVVDVGSDEPAQPVGDPPAYGVVEVVPQPGAGLVQGYRHRRGLHHRLGPVRDRRPPLGAAARIGPGGEPGRVPLDQGRGDPSARARDPEGREQEGAGEPLQPVGQGPGVTGPPGQPVLGQPRRRVRHQPVEQPIGDGFPVGAGPAGEGERRRSVGGSVELSAGDACGAVIRE